MYTKVKFGMELKKRVSQKQDRKVIGIWAYEIFLEYCVIFDDDFLSMLKVLSTMELGPDFYFSYKMLNKIADDIIAGKAVDLSLKEYQEMNS